MGDAERHWFDTWKAACRLWRQGDAEHFWERFGCLVVLAGDPNIPPPNGVNVVGSVSTIGPGTPVGLLPFGYAELVAAARDAVDTFEKGGAPGGPVMRLRAALQCVE